MSHQKELEVNPHLDEAIGVFANAIRIKNVQIERSVEELTYESELRFASLMQLVYLLADPDEHHDEDVRSCLEYIKFRLTQPETSDVQDRTLVFRRKDGQNMVVLQAFNVNDDDNIVGNRLGNTIINLYLTRKLNVNVYFRQRLVADSKPYCLVQYSEDEKYRFELGTEGKIIPSTDFSGENSSISEDEVRLDLYKTLNGIGHAFIYGDPAKIESAADMGAYILLNFADQLKADQLPNG